LREPLPLPAADGAASAAAAEAAARRSYGKLIAFLSARTRDVAAAEDALSDAFAAALADWPRHGVPRTPEAWLLTVARRRMIDAARARRQHDGAADTLRLLADWAVDDGARREIPDDRLALMFACAHPAIDAGVRAPLMLQTILGFDAVAIGSAFLVAPATMGQRLVRAKARIRQAGIPFAVPPLADLGERLAAVLDAIYACYAEGWSDLAGADARRRNLAEEALWLGGLVATLLPEEPEALGLLALMLFAQARRAARRDEAGRYVPLAEQDTARWDPRMMAEAERLLHRAGGLALAGGAASAGRVGRFQLEAALQSAHGVRRLGGAADWPAIVQLYDALHRLTGSPVVALNRAVALAETQGPAPALAALDALAGEARLADYQPYWAARAGLLQRLGQTAAADAAYARAIGLESDPAVRDFLQLRRQRAAGQGAPAV
jgi:RNA polymerase sigma-70 factor (ECF subfamily)